MHVISASRRTDIPAFHAEWLMRRIRAESVRVLSPYGGGVHEVSLAPEDVIAIVFWTKNAAPLWPYLDELKDRGHCFSFLYTINNYPAFLEPRVPDRGHTLKIVELLIRRFSASVFRWRYDTIVLTDVLNRGWHLQNFRELCRLLSPYTTECIFSFCDYYKKTARNMERRVINEHRPTEAECIDIAAEMADAAREWGISLASCAHDFLVSDEISKARCIDPTALAHVVNSPERKLALTALKTSPTRKDCGCAASRDIGAYDTCVHGCVYCYANSNPELAEKNRALIKPDSSCLDPRAGKNQALA
ncbi:MAG: DUF1848 domain-containing protein [Desulfomonilaceae bacterium]